MKIFNLAESNVFALDIFNGLQCAFLWKTVSGQLIVKKFCLEKNGKTVDISETFTKS